ncbi:MAG TPA: plastocyanin/azurin family copper-binding protein [Acidimicrobiia bacterium]|nr:plastocyanin/azurin family copper-binding protein [Acidimicrobiia bacterium]
MGTNRLARLVAITALCVALAACGGGGGGSGTTKTAVNGAITVNAADIHFDVNTIKASPGPLTVTLHNNGALDHNFEIDGQNFELKTSSSKRDATGTVNLQAGTYTFKCTVGSHAAQGMKGKIIVG